MTFVSCDSMVKWTNFLLLMLLLTTVAVGQTFTNVEPIQEVGSEYKVTAFTLDRDNNKYVGTNAGLVKVSDNGVVETLYSDGAVQAIVWHRQEGVWIGVDGNKVYQPATGAQIALEGEDISINAMSLSGTQVWVGTNNGVYVVSTKKKKVIEHYTTENSRMESNDVNDVFVDPSKVKWIGTDKGIVRVDNKKWKVYEQDYKFTAITGNSEGIWIAAGSEMWLVDKYNRWARTGVSDGLSYGEIRALAADQKGKIYILSEILVQFDPYTDVNVEIENEYTLQGGDDVALLVDMNNKVWVGTLEHGLTAMELEVSEDQPLIAYVSVVHPICNGEANGTLDVKAQGGRRPYHYTWSNNAFSGRSLAVLKAGDYAVTVTDADGFTYSLDVTLEDPKPMDLKLRVDESNGRVEAKITGGAGGYKYEWSNGAVTRSVANLEAGTHVLAVTDNYGCKITAEHTQIASAVAAPGIKPEVTPEVIPEASEGLTSAAALVAVDVKVLKTLDAATLAVGQTLRIDQLSFDADSTNINDQSKEVLDEVYTFLRSNDRIVVEIGGHTNGLPEHDYCDKLSSSRAESVANYLYDKGIHKGRIAYKGYGKRQPIATNSTVAGRKKNQRVELKVLEI
jgi:outer membrane protein OmpA-like peptidoglycan-associated protein